MTSFTQPRVPARVGEARAVHRVLRDVHVLAVRGDRRLHGRAAHRPGPARVAVAGQRHPVRDRLHEGALAVVHGHRVPVHHVLGEEQAGLRRDDGLGRDAAADDRQADQAERVGRRWRGWRWVGVGLASAWASASAVAPGSWVSGSRWASVSATPSRWGSDSRRGGRGRRRGRRVAVRVRCRRGRGIGGRDRVLQRGRRRLRRRRRVARPSDAGPIADRTRPAVSSARSAERGDG